MSSERTQARAGAFLSGVARQGGSVSHMIIHVDESPVGTGKTDRAIRDALRLPSRWLFAVERREAVAELAARIAALALPPSPVKIVKISSDEPSRGSSVSKEIASLPERYQQGHIIAICTHEGLLASDLGGFVGWHLVVDEVPNVLTSDERQTKLDVSFFETHYRLTAINDDWSWATLTDAGRSVTGSDLYQDDSHRHLRLFHQRVTRSTDTQRAVICNLRSWQDMEGDNVKWIWWSLFSPSELRAFASVRFLGNGFMAAVTTKMMQSWDRNVIWKPFTTQGERQLVHRRVSVRYFSEQRRAAKSFFESAQGVHALERIGEHISSHVSRERFIWSSNEAAKAPLREHLPQSAYLTPKQAGSDKWMHCTHAAMFYAAKPNPNIRSVLNALGVNHEAWIETNEFETILQFVTRTSIRDVRSAEHATVYVFDRWQAEYLMRFFESQPHIEADVEWVDLHIDFSPAKPGPKVRSLTPDESASRKEARLRKKAQYERARRAALKAAE